MERMRLCKTKSLSRSAVVRSLFFTAVRLIVLLFEPPSLLTANTS